MHACAADIERATQRLCRNYPPHIVVLALADGLAHWARAYLASRAVSAANVALVQSTLESRVFQAPTLSAEDPIDPKNNRH